MKKSQRGFSAVEALLILVIVGILSFVGWYVWHTKNNANSTYNNASNTNQTTASKKSASAQTQPQKYLDITEWKVKLPVSGAITDAYYVVSTSSQDSNGQPNAVWLGIKSLDNLCAAANANKGGKPLGAIIKALPTDTDPVSGDSYQQKDPNGTTLSGYYYGYGDWITKNPCTTSASYQSQLKDINSAFAAAAKNIVAE